MSDRGHRTSRRITARGQALAGGTALVVLVDQVTKAASGHLAALPGVLPVRNDALSLQIVDSGRLVEVLAMLLGVIVAACWLIPRARGTGTVVGTTLVLGGAAGNLVDRAACGYVRDFLAVGPVVVNLADLAVIAGLALLLAHRPAIAHTRRPAIEGR